MAGVSGILVEQRVHFRDEQGQFLARVDAAGVVSSKQLADAIEHIASQRAWPGSGPVTATSHGWSAVATAWGQLARIQEFGARAHTIAPKYVEGGADGYLGGENLRHPVHGPVWHPGVKAQHFLSEAGAIVGSIGIGLIAKNFPR